MEPKKTYHVRNSEKCYRFKPDAFVNHAPGRPGIYELVTFDAAGTPAVLYVGAAFDKTIRACLEGHATGTLPPAASDLMANHANLYFDFLDEMDARSREDAQDIYWWLVQKHKPAYNEGPVANSGRFESIDVIEG